MSTKLSRNAKAVLNAYRNHQEKDEKLVAAVLLKIADFVRMDEPLGDTDADAGVFAAHHAICGKLLLLAKELDPW